MADAEKPAAPRDGLAAIEAELATGGAAPREKSQAELAAADVQAKADAHRKEVEEWAGLPFVFGAIVSEAMPELSPHYTTEKCVEWAERMLPVAQRYGWTAGVAGAWCALIGVTWGMAKPTFEAVKKKRAENKAHAEKKVPDQPAS